jgi:hypothetical protein
MEWAPVYHIKGWGKFNRNYGDFYTGADKSVLPCKEPREQNHGQAGSVRSPSRFDLALQVESQLFPKEDIFRFEGSARTRPQK